MKFASTAKLPKKTSAKVNDPNHLASTEDMLCAPVVKRGRDPKPLPQKFQPLSAWMRIFWSSSKQKGLAINLK